jgi:hypothetical protein
MMVNAKKGVCPLSIAIVLLGGVAALIALWNIPSPDWNSAQAKSMREDLKRLAKMGGTVEHEMDIIKYGSVFLHAIVRGTGDANALAQRYRDEMIAMGWVPKSTRRYCKNSAKAEVFGGVGSDGQPVFQIDMMFDSSTVRECAQ